MKLIALAVAFWLNDVLLIAVVALLLACCAEPPTMDEKIEAELQRRKGGGQ